MNTDSFSIVTIFAGIVAICILIMLRRHLKKQVTQITEYIAYKQTRTIVRWRVVCEANTYQDTITVSAKANVLKIVQELSFQYEEQGLSPIKKVKLTPIFADETDY